MNHLVIENLSKYYGQICALDHVNLNLKTGIYGLLGQNGAGKSTLMKILTRNIMQSSGLISYNGVDISAKDSTFIHQVGYMPQQQDMIPSFSVASFMYYMACLKSMHKSVIEEEIRGFLKATNTYSFKDRSLASLSGGMKQRVLIAQALLNNPKILLLDEPTAGLDPLERLNFRDIIAQHAQDKIIILATHVISDIELIADRIIFLQNGKVLTVNSQNHLLEQTKVYETMEDINHLKASDSSIKVINRLPSKMGIKTRFISKMVYEHSVSTTLDDVYIDWLGNR